MMLSVQNNFGSRITFPPATTSVAFSSANTQGNGLIVVACLLAAQAAPNLAISDSQGNTYLPLGGSGKYDGVNWTLLVNAWYVQSCKAGANTVTVTHVNAGSGSDAALTLSIFEYPGALGALDVSTFTSGLSQTQMKMNVITSAEDLLFAFGVSLMGSGLSVDAGSTGWTQEQSESVVNSSAGTTLWCLAVDQAANQGPASLVLDIAGAASVDVGLLIAFPAPVTTTIYRPTTYTDSGTYPTIEPTWAYDGNLATWAQVVGIIYYGVSYNGDCTWHGFTNPGGSRVAVSLMVYSKEIQDTTTPSVATLRYSLDGGSTWTNIRSTSASWDASTTPDVVALPSTQDLSLVRVEGIQPAPLLAYSDGLNIYEIEIEVEFGLGPAPPPPPPGPPTPPPASGSSLGWPTIF